MSDPVYQCLNLHVSDENGNCSVDGCPYGPNPKPKSEGKYRTSKDKNK